MQLLVAWLTGQDNIMKGKKENKELMWFSHYQCENIGEGH